MKMLLFISKLPSSSHLVMFGGLIARQTQSSIALLTVVPRRESLNTGEGVLLQAREMIPDVVENIQIRRGNIIEGIFDEIQSRHYELVILRESQAIGPIERLRRKEGLIIANKAPTSVLLVKQEQPKLERVLICTSGLEIAEPVLKMDAQLAQAVHAQATLLYVAIPIPTMYTGLGKIEETILDLLQSDTPVGQHLRNAAEILDRHNFEANLRVRHGEVVNEILAGARSGNYDLIILGASRSDFKLSSWLLGNVTRKIINRAHCQVLIVRQADEL